MLQAGGVWWGWGGGGGGGGGVGVESVYRSDDQVKKLEKSQSVADTASGALS